MQSLKATHISPREWRWVFAIGGALTAFTLLPYAWALASNAATSEWQFMGILANPLDGATYLAKIGQGARGAWLTQLTHTLEPHSGAAIDIFYLLLGHLANLIGLSNIVTFHLARVATTLFMFSALYQFGATVWPRLRPRRVFFALVSVGSGLGWLIFLLDPTATNVPDVTVAEAYPLYSAFANPHLPLAVGCLALLASLYINAFRIDFTEAPTAVNGGLGITLSTLVLAFVLPQVLVPISGTLTVYLIVLAVQRHAIPIRELRWVMMSILWGSLVGIYYLIVLNYNPAMNEVWNSPGRAATLSPGLILMGYGLLLLTAVPGLVRAVKYFERDGDQLLLIWLVTNLVLVFLPTSQQRQLMIGLIIPIVFFAVRSIEDYWLRVLPQRWGYPALLALIVFVMPSNILALSFPLYGLVVPQAGLEQQFLVERGYWETMRWLYRDESTGPDDIVLSSPNISLWIPAWAETRVVYGHPRETLNANAKKAQVEQWYQGIGCETLLNSYPVRYVIVGPQERAIGASATNSDACYAALANDANYHIAGRFTDVTLYERAN